MLAVRVRGGATAAGLSALSAAARERDAPRACDLLDAICPKQVYKLINVIKVQDLDPRDSIERELVLFKVNAAPERRHEVIEVANVFRAKIVDVGKNSVTIEATGATDKIDAMEDLFRAYGIKEMARTGKIALARGGREG